MPDAHIPSFFECLIIPRWLLQPIFANVAFHEPGIAKLPVSNSRRWSRFYSSIIESTSEASYIPHASQRIPVKNRLPSNFFLKKPLTRFWETNI